MRYLSLKDKKVSKEHYGAKKRPFIGVLVLIGGMQYIIPLTSPKPKHKRMSNSIDFHKIDGGNHGAMNFNNMLPINSLSLQEIDINSEIDLQYRMLLRNQITWANNGVNRKIIQNKADSLLLKYKNSNLNKSVHMRCCNFNILENASKQWTYDYLTIRIRKKYEEKEFINIEKNTDNIFEYSKYISIQNGMVSSVEQINWNTDELQLLNVYAKDEYGQEKKVCIKIKITPLNNDNDGIVVQDKELQETK